VRDASSQKRSLSLLPGAKELPFKQPLANKLPFLKKSAIDMQTIFKM
jgi:hypothetical protein